MYHPNRFINTSPDIHTYNFKVNRNFPNSKYPLIIYKGGCVVGKQPQVAVKAFQKLFNKNNWKNSWSNGIYTFHHYHSNTHECMGIAAGKAWVIFGGPGGRKLLLEKSDIVIIPAGLGHKCSKASADFLCVGAYPGGKEYDTNVGKKQELEAAKKRIEKLRIPAMDPVFGKEGFIKTFWK